MFLRFVVFVLSGLCMLSCSKENVIVEEKFNDRFPFNCFEEIEIDAHSLNLVYPNELDTNKYCEVTLVENPILLEEENKFWIAQLCNPMDNVFTYVNEEGAELRLSAFQNHVAYYSTEVGLSEGCMDDKESLYFFQQESARVNLNFSNSTKEISIFLSNRVTLKNGSITVFPVLNITYQKDNLYYTVMDLNLNQLDTYNSTEIELIEVYEIFNEVFRNVYTDHRFPDNESIQVFYNQAYGIVAFIDRNNVLWKLKT